MARDYTIRDAQKALYQFHVDRAVAEVPIGPTSRSEWTDAGPGRFTCHEDRDPREEILVTVQFTDDEGNATVTFANGESGDVNIRDDDGDDEEDDEDIDDIDD